MKDKFYSVINFFREIHLFEYMGYIMFVSFAFYLFEEYNMPIKIFELIIGCVISMAFMNTWEIEVKNYSNKKNINNNKKDIDK